MLIRPPAPPKPSMMKENAAPSMTGVRHGNFVSHPSDPRPPRSRAAISTDAQMVNTLSSVGMTTNPVNTECRNLNPEPTCGSSNKRCAPIGMATTRNSMKEILPIWSLNSLPPIARGTIV